MQSDLDTLKRELAMLTRRIEAATAASPDDTAEAPKRGRKACAPEHLRRGRNFRASDEEWGNIQAAADRAGKGVTTWARETLVEAAEAT